MAYDSKHTEILTPEEGYNITKDEYKKYWPHLNTFYSIDFNRFVPRVRKDYRVLDLWAWDWRMYEQLKKINPDDYVACDCAKELLSKHPWRIKKLFVILKKIGHLRMKVLIFFLHFFCLSILKTLNTFLVRLIVF